MATPLCSLEVVHLPSMQCNEQPEAARLDREMLACTARLPAKRHAC